MSSNIIDGIHKILMENVDGLASDRFFAAINNLKCYEAVGKAKAKVQIRWMTSFWANVLKDHGGMSMGLMNQCMECKTFGALFKVFKTTIMPIVSIKSLPLVTPTVPAIGAFE